MSGSGGQKKRFWSDEEKRLICAQARMEGASVARVAGRYLLNANVLHKWLRDPRYATDDTGLDASSDNECHFLPVEVDGHIISVSQGSEAGAILESPREVVSHGVSAQRVDITLSDGRRILVEGSTALSAVILLVEGLIP